ncbi:aspartyl-tRNA synthetase [Piedraia hortae CBS 480.64]|uniref:Probable aspartate--tRNA ligase, cytoplasmic n=1 Tax=Piedraia hortae CBS 480.64 TaxID=1314780 RepID=A0A6A7C2I5_9PEZI|nr:aspartyl-tRNA synthetase [Piedraia hortae CBS 480.64]
MEPGTGNTPAPAEENKGPSKNALKKAQKEKEKAEKAAKRAAEEAERKRAAEANDASKADYGELGVLDDPNIPEGVPIKSLPELKDEGDVIFQAQVDNARSQSANLAFVIFKDQGETLQAVVAKSETISKQMVKFSSGIPAESVVLVHATITKPQDPVKSCSIQTIEAHVKKIFVTSKADVQLPLQVADSEQPVYAEGEEPSQEEEAARPIVGLAVRLNNRVIDLRARQNQAIMTVRHGVKRLFREFFEARNFQEIETPKLLGASSEGGANVFEVTYFNKKAYLAQSPQLYKQMLIAAGKPGVFEIGPVFRAENSNTARHLTEFVGLDMEMPFVNNYHEVVSLLEELMLFIFNGLGKRYSKAVEVVRSVYNVPEFKLPEAGKVPRLAFSEGIQMLREAGEKIEDYEDLSTPQEKKLGALVLEKYGSDFYVLDKFPLGIRPFYTMPDKETYNKTSDPNAGYSNSYDFFMRGQEIMSGAQRIHQADFLEKRMREHVTPVDPESPGLKDYVNAFRAGCPRHAGGGLGLDRIVMLYLGLPNIRLASLFPRDPQRLAP